MRWIKKIEPVVLYQSLDIPYIILANGVRLCSDNFYSESPSSGGHSIVFETDRRLLTRQSSTYYKLFNFPTTIPFEDILSLDETVIEGRVIKNAATIQNDTKDIIIVKGAYLPTLSDDEFQDFVSVIEEQDKAYLLTQDPIEPIARLLDDITHTIYHDQEQGWGRTCVSILDSLCEEPYRKYCWTHTVPSLNIKCYGMIDGDDMKDFNVCMNDIGLQSFDAVWDTNQCE